MSAIRRSEGDENTFKKKTILVKITGNNGNKTHLLIDSHGIIIGACLCNYGLYHLEMADIC